MVCSVGIHDDRRRTQCPSTSAIPDGRSSLSCRFNNGNIDRWAHIDCLPTTPALFPAGRMRLFHDRLRQNQIAEALWLPVCCRHGRELRGVKDDGTR